ncbi:ATP-binding protein [Streptomyces sp. NPDC002845]
MELAGRDRQLAELAHCLESFAERSLDMVCVAGSAGSGKTALLRRFGEQVLASGARYLNATASRGRRPSPSASSSTSCPRRVFHGGYADTSPGW